jgi:hypothetical protein
MIEDVSTENSLLPVDQEEATPEDTSEEDHLQRDDWCERPTAVESYQLAMLAG